MTDEFFKVPRALVRYQGKAKVKRESRHGGKKRITESYCRLSPRAMFLYAVLLNYSGKDRTRPVHPSQRRLAYNMAVSEKTIRRYMAELEAHKLIFVDRSRHRRETDYSTRYKVYHYKINFNHPIYQGDSTGSELTVSDPPITSENDVSKNTLKDQSGQGKDSDFPIGRQPSHGNCTSKDAVNSQLESDKDGDFPMGRQPSDGRFSMGRQPSHGKGRQPSHGNCTSKNASKDQLESDKNGDFSMGRQPSALKDYLKEYNLKENSRASRTNELPESQITTTQDSTTPESTAKEHAVKEHIETTPPRGNGKATTAPEPIDPNNLVNWSQININEWPSARLRSEIAEMEMEPAPLTLGDDLYLQKLRAELRDRGEDYDETPF